MYEAGRCKRPAAQPQPARLCLACAAAGLLHAAGAAETASVFAVIVCASRFWHNYRHAANVLSVYTEVRRQAPRLFRPSAVKLPQCRELGLGREAQVRFLPGWASQTAALCSCWQTTGPATRATPSQAPCTGARTARTICSWRTSRHGRNFGNPLAGASASRQQCTEFDIQQGKYEQVRV